MDWVWAVLFFAWFELLSLPLRLALAASPAPADVRRLVSRLAGAVVLLMPIWFAGHLAGWVLGGWIGLAWIGAGLWLGLRIGRGGRPAGSPEPGLARCLGYADGAGSDGRRSVRAWLDVLTLLMFLGVVGWRRWAPEMTTYVIDTSAAEKFMNAMIWWSTWDAPKLPPQDYWLAGHPLTYYYWGHWHWTWVSRVGGFPASLALTLAFARMATMGWEAMVLLARALGLRPGGAMLAGLAAAWGGNPSAVGCAWAALQPRPPGWGGDWSAWLRGGPVLQWRWYDFWKPSRAISDSLVDEFPAFSTILGDFHAHQLALGWMIGWLALLAAGWRWAGLPRRLRAREAERAVWVRLTTWGMVWVALGLAATLGNVWNLPVIGIALAAAMVWGEWRLRGEAFARLPIGTALVAALVLAVWLGMRLMRGGEALPLQEAAAAEAGWLARLGVMPLPPALRSTLAQLWSMWGFAALPVGVAAGGRLLRRPGWGAAAWWLMGSVLVAMGWPYLNTHLRGGTAWVWVGVGCWGVSLGLGRRPWLTGSGPASWVGACALLAGLELKFIDDAMAGALERYNTYFKLSYPVWPVLMVLATQALLGLARVGRAAGWGRRLAGWGWRGSLGLWLALLAVFPLMGGAARLARAMVGDQPPRRPTLNAFDFLTHRQKVGDADMPYFREWPMLEWIRSHVPAGQVVVEAAWARPGEALVGGYAYNGRVASLAGHPVPLGWAHHEHQWRGLPAMRLTAERQAAIDRLYTAPTPEAMRSAAQALGARWVLYGILEHDRYANQKRLGMQVLVNLSRAGGLAAAFPADRPAIFLFDFQSAARKMNTP